jgi:hypothetical protein
MPARLILASSLALIGFALMGFAAACTHRYSENREDWVGPHDGDFERDLAACRRRMDAAPFRYGGDRRLIFLDCMERRDWHLKGRS